MTNILSSRRLSGIFSLGTHSSVDSNGLEREVAVRKDQKGYGFQVSGECPAFIIKVRDGSLAQKNGLEAYDVLIKVDSENVTSLPHDKIVEIIKERDSFNLTVRKRTANEKNPQITPSYPLPDSPQSDTIARLGGYDITCNMIVQEHKRLMAFESQIRSESLPEDELAKLKSSMSTSRQIIQNLQKKIPESYLERMKTELNLDGAFSDEERTKENTNSSQQGDEEDESAVNDLKLIERSGSVKRNSSLNDRISRTHSISQDVIASFRSLRLQRKSSRMQPFPHYASVQNLNSGRDAQNLSVQQKGGLSRINAARSESNLNDAVAASQVTSNGDNHNSEDHRSTLRVGVNDMQPPPSPFLQPMPGSNGCENDEVAQLNTGFARSTNSTASFLCVAIKELCSNSQKVEVRRVILEAVKETFFINFMNMLLSSPQKDKKDKEELQRHVSTLRDMFIRYESPMWLNMAPLQDACPMKSVDEFYKMCQDSLSQNMNHLLNLFPQWQSELSAKVDIEKELNNRIVILESAHCTDLLTDDVKKCLGDCIVTFLKANKKRYREPKWVVNVGNKSSSSHKSAYVNLFSKKRSNQSMHRSAFKTVNGHKFQIAMMGNSNGAGGGLTSISGNPEQRKCEQCSSSIGGSSGMAGSVGVVECVICHAVLHNKCQSHYQVHCPSSNVGGGGVAAAPLNVNVALWHTPSHSHSLSSPSVATTASSASQKSDDTDSTDSFTVVNSSSHYNHEYNKSSSSVSSQSNQSAHNPASFKLDHLSDSTMVPSLPLHQLSYPFDSTLTQQHSPQTPMSAPPSESGGSNSTTGSEKSSLFISVGGGANIQSRPPPSSSSSSMNNQQASVKRTSSMNEDKVAISRNRKASNSTSKTSPRNASDPVSSMVEAASHSNTNQQISSNINSSSSPSCSSEMSLNNSHSSLMEEIDENIREKFNVVSYHSSSFYVTDDFATVDQVVTPKVFKKLEKDDRKQQNILLEFLNSEKKQTYNLKLLTTVFESVLQGPHRGHLAAINHGSNNSNQHASFPAVESLIEFHFSFYLKMLGCLNRDMLFKNIGHVFLEIFEKSDYCNKFSDYYSWTCGVSVQSERVRKLEAENRVKLDKRCLGDLLMSEVQRATKYKLLMEGVMKCSTHCSKAERSNLQSALDAVTKLIGEVNVAKGILDYRAIVSRVDRSEIDQGPDCYVTANSSPADLMGADSDQAKKKATGISSTADSKKNAQSGGDAGPPKKRINMKQIDLIHQPHIAYTMNYVLYKWHQEKPKQVFKNYLVILFKEYLVFIERDPSSEKLTWKPFIDTDKIQKSVILLENLYHATIDSSKPLKTDDQREMVRNQDYNFICIGPGVLLNVFLATNEEKLKWKAIWADIFSSARSFKKFNTTKVGQQSETVETFPAKTDAVTYNFESQVVYVDEVQPTIGTIDEDKTRDAKVTGDAREQAQNVGGFIKKSPSTEEINSQKRLEKIHELRSQIMDILKQSFDLARSVYDPNNTMDRENLAQAHECVVNEQLQCLVDKEQWLRQVDTPLMSLAGGIDCDGMKRINRVEYFLNDHERDGQAGDAAKTVECTVTEQLGVAVIEADNKLKAFSDLTDEPDEIHMQKSDIRQLSDYTYRMGEKIDILKSQIGRDGNCGSVESLDQLAAANRRNSQEPFFDVCGGNKEADEDQNKRQVLPESNEVKNGAVCMGIFSDPSLDEDDDANDTLTSHQIEYISQYKLQLSDAVVDSSSVEEDPESATPVNDSMPIGNAAKYVQKNPNFPSSEEAATSAAANMPSPVSVYDPSQPSFHSLDNSNTSTLISCSSSSTQTTVANRDLNNTEQNCCPTRLGDQSSSCDGQGELPPTAKCLDNSQEDMEKQHCSQFDGVVMEEES